MRAYSRILFGWLVFSVLGFVQTATADTYNPPEFRLTLELQDGSRIVGKSGEDYLEMRSDVLGALKLPLDRVRTIEVSNRTNLAKLTTTKSDSLAVEFAMKEIRLETTYGKISVPVSEIKRLKVSSGAQVVHLKDGLVGLWPGNGDAYDSVGGNDGIVENARFTDGVAGLAFSFTPNLPSSRGYMGVKIPDIPAYALTKSLSVECWVRPRGNSGVIFFRGDHRPGLDPYAMSLDSKLNVTFVICDENDHTDQVKAPVEMGAWTHVAATLDGDTGALSIYTNGMLAMQIITSVRPFGELDPNQTPGIGIGNVNEGGNNFPFIGDIDEVGLYNRALSDDEVSALYLQNAANAGTRVEPLPPRRITPVRGQFPTGI